MAEKTEKTSEEKLRESAYYKWEKAGRPNGDGQKFWLEAEKEAKDKQKEKDKKKK